MTYLGLDSCPAGWIAVAIDDAGYLDAYIAPGIEAAVSLADTRWTVSAVVVDIPIGIPDAGARQADVLARRFIAPRGGSVFPTPVRTALESASYPEAAAASLLAQGKSLSTQAYAIRDKILDVDGFVRAGGTRVFEGHPEVSFRVLSGEGIEHPKKSFAGMLLRHELLTAAGIKVPLSIEKELRGAKIDDILDAAAMAWTARRIATGDAGRFPPAIDAEHFSDGIDSTIWF